MYIAPSDITPGHGRRSTDPTSVGRVLRQTVKKLKHFLGRGMRGIAGIYPSTQSMHPSGSVHVGESITSPLPAEINPTSFILSSTNCRGHMKKLEKKNQGR